MAHTKLSALAVTPRLGLALKFALVLLLAVASYLPAAAAAAPRERASIDQGWTFALGHADDPERDFGHGTAAFFFAKAGYGDGPASAKFDDRAWRKLDLPHDWAVEAAFDRRGNTNHGSKAVGPGFPENNIGWYRKRLDIAKSDEGRRISVEFDGVYRDAVVWFNGHYIGRAQSGYSSFRYDLTDYVNYVGANILVLRVNASVEEGWFYEGAGIYRHVWLTKTDPLHVPQWGTFVTTTLKGADAAAIVRAKVTNEDTRQRTFTVDQEVLDAAGRSLAVSHGAAQVLAPGATAETMAELSLPTAKLWSIDTPYLHRLVTTVRENGAVKDRYETTFGVREIRWDADTGFWLNGKNIKLKGTNNHQDHAGVGAAIPDALQVYRLQRLKAMGSNAYRTSHNPPTPEMLDAADRLGMVVIDEHRMMGTSPEISDELRRLIERDRNHPSVILWSVGNEEWALEGNDLGARLTKLMQEKVRALDPSRPAGVAMSGGSGRGSSTTTEVMGFNYRSQHDVDAYHRAFPHVPAAMTESGSTVSTRGVYFSNPEHQHLAAYDKPQRPTGSSSIEQEWQAVVERPWMAGMFVWTGFDYRGETTPFGWPAISSQFGMLDTTGLFKDSAYYLKSWWLDEPMAHIVGHWTWPDRLGQTIPIWVYSNADEVELLLNGRSLGRRAMPRNGHLEWEVAYAPGSLVAKGYRAGRVIASDTVETAGPARAVRLNVDRASLRADGRDLAVVTVSVVDAKGRIVPMAGDKVSFELTGPGRIIGVGNGDPSSHEADRFVDGYQVGGVGNWQIADLDEAAAAGALPALSTLQWRDPFRWYPPGSGPKTPTAFVLRGRWRSDGGAGSERTLYIPLLSKDQRVLVAGRDLTSTVKADAYGQSVTMADMPAEGDVDVAIVVPSNGEAALRTLQDVGVGGKNVGFVGARTPAAPWARSVFNGYAQVIVQADGKPGSARLRATAPGLTAASLVIQTAE